jgi:predicted ATPase
MTLKSLTLRGYKSIASLEKFEFLDLNVLIGANGAGKSNLISVFRLLNEMYEQRLQVFVQRQGGPDALLHFGRKRTEKIHAEFYFDNNGYKFDLVPTVDNRLIFDEEHSWFKGVRYPTSSNIELGRGHAESKLKETLDGYSEYVRRALSKWRIYHFHDTSESAPVKRIHAVNDNLILKPDASNLGAFVRRLKHEFPDAYARIVSAIRLALPFFYDFVHRETVEQVELEWFLKGRTDTPLKAHVLSDGSLRFICLMVLLNQPQELMPKLILVDEPELGLHPAAISILAEQLKRVCEDLHQVIVSTQSVELVNEFSPENVVVVDQTDGASTFNRLQQDKLEAWLSDYALGELWKKNILGGRP